MVASRRIALPLLAVLAVQGLLGCGGGEGGPQATPEVSAGPEALPVETRTVELAEGYRFQERSAGRIVSRRSSALGFDRGGRIHSVLVDEGDRVEAGAVLAQLDTRELESRRRELEAQVHETSARLELAGLTSKRRAQLLQNQSISPQRRDEALYDARALDARLAAARAAIESVDVSLDLSRLIAPYAGSVTERLADEGSIVSPGQTILSLIEDRVLELRVGLPAEAAASLDAGAVYEVEVEERSYPARLHAVLDTVEPDTRTVTAILHFVTQPEGVRSGTLARLAVERFVPESGFWLPITALAESRRGLWSVYAVVPDPATGAHRVERRELQVLHAESDRAYVRGTVQGGEQVVATGLHRLVPGQRVRVLR